MSVHGTARFATRGELVARGYLAEWTPGETPDGLLVGWWLEDRYDFAPITYKGDLHQLIVGGIGSGKFTTALAPLLLGSGLDEQSVVVIDPKGEIASLAGKLFQKPFADKRSVHLLDPWDACGTGETGSLNFLDLLHENNPNLVDDARALADAMVIPSGNQNTHWDNAARNFAAALMLYVALDPSETDKTLLRIRDLITRPWVVPKTVGGRKPESLSGLLYANVESTLAEGAVRRGFTALLNRDEKERAGVVSSLERDTAWLDSPNMKKVLRGPHGVDLKEAALGGGKYFVVLPAEYFTTHRGWLRLCVAAFASAFKRHKPEPDKPLHKRWRHIVIDEFANLGEMTSILTDIAVSRGYEVKYHFAVQDLPQLKRIYGDGWESFVNNAFLRVFGINDLFSADYISRMLGSATVKSVSTSEGGGRSRGHTTGTSQGRTSGTSDPRGFLARGTSTSSEGVSESWSDSWSDSTSHSWSESVSQVQRPLHTADEVRRLPESDEYLQFRGMHPVQCWRPPYWTIFPSLPDFTLKEVLGTVGRMPRDEAERERFTAWRKLPLMMKPLALPAPEPKPVALPAPPDVVPAKKRWPIYAGIATALLAWWLGSLAWNAYVERGERLAREEAARVRTVKLRAEASDAYTNAIRRTETDAGRSLAKAFERIASEPQPSPVTPEDAMIKVYAEIITGHVRRLSTTTIDPLPITNAEKANVRDALNRAAAKFDATVGSLLRQAEARAVKTARAKVIADAAPRPPLLGRWQEVAQGAQAEAVSRINQAAPDDAARVAAAEAVRVDALFEDETLKVAKASAEPLLKGKAAEINASVAREKELRVDQLTFDIAHELNRIAFGAAAQRR